MNDFSTILLINVLRATVWCVEESPGMDRNDPSTRRFVGALVEEIARLVGQSSPRIPAHAA